MTRSEARHLGLKTYFNGMCRNGHESGRYVSNGSCIECVRQFAVNNPEVNRKAVNEYHKRNPDVIREGLKIWRKKNPEKSRLQKHIRRNAEGSFTPEEIQSLLKNQEGLCTYCSSDITTNYEIDHIKPVSKGGTNWIENLQLLCRSCNAKKSDKYPYIP